MRFGLSTIVTKTTKNRYERRWSLRTRSKMAFERRLTSPGLPTWRPRRPTWRPKRPTWRPRRPNLALGGRPERVPARHRSDLERPGAPKGGRNRFFVDFWPFLVDFSSIFLHSEVDFRSVLASFFSEFSVRSSHVFLWVFACLRPGFPTLPVFQRVPAASGLFGFTPCSHTLQTHHPPSIGIKTDC